MATKIQLAAVIENIDDSIIDVNDQNQILFKNNDKDKTVSFIPATMTRRLMANTYSEEEEEEEEDDEDDDEEEEQEEEENENNNQSVPEQGKSSIFSIPSLSKAITESNLNEEKTFRGRPSSCVFVASLSAAMSDDHLCVSVTNHFKQWGDLSTVKVLRDPSNRPYAFVQYTSDMNARIAIAEGQHSILDGRAIRCEAARVNRTLYVLSNGTALSREEMQENLEKYGEIEQLVGSESGNNVSFKGAPQNRFNRKFFKAWFAKYAYRDDAIRAYANLRSSAAFAVEWAQNLDPPPFEVKEDVTIDKFSIFVGQLNSTVSKDELTERFQRHGSVVETVLVNKPNNNFAFIKFETESAAAAAVERENHAMFKEKTMHVQYREIHHHLKSFKRFGEPRLSLAPPPINFPVRRASTGSGFSRYNNIGNNNYTSNSIDRFPKGQTGNWRNPHVPSNGFSQFSSALGPRSNNAARRRIDLAKSPTTNTASFQSPQFKTPSVFTTAEINTPQALDDEHIAKTVTLPQQQPDSDAKQIGEEQIRSLTPKRGPKLHSPNTSPSNQTTNSGNVPKTVYSPSSMVNSDKLEDPLGASKHKRRASLPTLPSRAPSAPYFYYVPSNEIYDNNTRYPHPPPSGNGNSGYFYPYPYFPGVPGAYNDPPVLMDYNQGQPPPNNSGPLQYSYYMYYPTLPMNPATPVQNNDSRNMSAMIPYDLLTPNQRSNPSEVVEVPRDHFNGN